MDHREAAELTTALEMFLDDPKRFYVMQEAVPLYMVEPLANGAYSHNCTKLLPDRGPGQPAHEITFLSLWTRLPSQTSVIVHRVAFPDGFDGYVDLAILPGSKYLKPKEGT